jgi:hypothetical protein
MAAVATNMRLSWNTKAACWVIDISDSAGNPILQGVALVCGADLLEQFAYLDLGGQMIAQTDHATDAPPTYTNLGSSGHLLFLPTPTT